MSRQSPIHIPKIGYVARPDPPSRTALQTRFGDAVNAVGYTSARGLIAATANGYLDEAVLPWETTSHGGFIASYDALLESPSVYVTGEVLLDDSDVQGRFLIVRPTALPLCVDRLARTILVVELPDRPGTLMHLFSRLADRGVNVVKVDTRPSGFIAWTYRLLMELQHHVTALGMQRLMADLQAATREFRIIGTYEIAAKQVRYTGKARQRRSSGSLAGLSARKKTVAL